MRMKVMPATGMKIRNPENGYQHLPDDGAWVLISEYWINHIRDGAVIQIDGPPLD